jgi:hypothetical protein
MFIGGIYRLKMEVALSSETLVTTYKTTQPHKYTASQHNPEDQTPRVMQANLCASSVASITLVPSQKKLHDVTLLKFEFQQSALLSSLLVKTLVSQIQELAIP